MDDDEYDDEEYGDEEEDVGNAYGDEDYYDEEVDDDDYYDEENDDFYDYGGRNARLGAPATAPQEMQISVEISELKAN